ncbi:MAG: hypothetical protein ABEH78_09315 [Haloferacaceae archaeon]
MAIWLDVTRVVAGLNVLLLAGLSALWLRNYRTFPSRQTLGLSAFALLLLLENAVALYVFAAHPLLSEWIATSAPLAQGAMMGLRLLEGAALVAIAWSAWD